VWKVDDPEPSGLLRRGRSNPEGEHPQTSGLLRRRRRDPEGKRLQPSGLLHLSPATRKLPAQREVALEEMA
jgi:hypothetical protein